MKWWFCIVACAALSACSTPRAVQVDCDGRLVPINAAAPVVPAVAATATTPEQDGRHHER